MKAVFSLQPGQAAVAPNERHSRVYVVRFLSQEPSDEILRQQFLDTGRSFVNFQGRLIANQDRQEFVNDWYRELEKQYRVTWHRPPQQAGRRAM